MTQLLLALEDKSLAKSLQVLSVKAYGYEALAFDEPTQMLSMLEILPDIKMIITSEKYNKKVCDYLIRNHENFDQRILVLTLGVNNSLYPHVTAISAKLSPQSIIHHAGFALGLEEAPPASEVVPAPVKEAEPEEVPEEKTTVFKMPDMKALKGEAAVKEEPKPVAEFQPVSTKYFLHLPESKIDFDVYSRIKKGDDFTYNVKIAAGTVASREEIDRILLRGGKDLYVKKENFASANEFFSTHFINRFKNPSLSVIDRMMLNSESYEILLDVFKDSSFTKYSIEIIKELIKSIDILLNSPNPVEAYFIGMKQKNLSYGYCHSYLSGLLIFKIIENFPWKKDQSKNKILYLALFHDLALHTNRLIELHHNYSKESSKMTEIEKQVILNHADAAASILEKIVKAPKELTTLIREHHGISKGVGFTDSLSISINPLSMAWIVTEEFVTNYLRLWNSTTRENTAEFIKTFPEEIFNELKVKYDKLTYAEVVEELMKYIKGLQ